MHFSIDLNEQPPLEALPKDKECNIMILALWYSLYYCLKPLFVKITS